jgi:hypothetical protein
VSYDRLDWHLDSALGAGQPAENAFAHIGLYLAWLIRHDLHDPAFFPADHIAALKGGEMTGSDLADDVDTKLVSPYMTAEGRAFSDACYGSYLDAYAAVFAGTPDYGVIDDAAAYARIAPAIDRLYGAWVAEGRPAPPPQPTPDLSALDLPPPEDISKMSREQIEALMGEIAARVGGVVSSPPDWAEMPHAASHLEALLPTDITAPPLQATSVSASTYGSSLLNRALKRLGVQPRAVTVVTAMGGTGPEVLVVTLYEVPGVTAVRLETEFAAVIVLPPRGSWTSSDVAGRTRSWASGKEFTVAFWANDGLVVHVAGRAEDVERAIPLLP